MGGPPLSAMIPKMGWQPEIPDASRDSNVTALTRRYMWSPVRAFGQTIMLVVSMLAICYERTDVPATITPVGPGVGSPPNGNPIKVEYGPHPMSLNAGSVPAGNYNVGLCGYVAPDQPGNGAADWDRNDAGYTTAFVIQR